LTLKKPASFVNEENSSFRVNIVQYKMGEGHFSVLCKGFNDKKQVMIPDTATRLLLKTTLTGPQTIADLLAPGYDEVI
jgi:hypothetical protein